MATQELGGIRDAFLPTNNTTDYKSTLGNQRPLCLVARRVRRQWLPGGASFLVRLNPFKQPIKQAVTSGSANHKKKTHQLYSPLTLNVSVTMVSCVASTELAAFLLMISERIGLLRKCHAQDTMCQFGCHQYQGENYSLVRCDAVTKLPSKPCLEAFAKLMNAVSTRGLMIRVSTQLIVVQSKFHVGTVGRLCGPESGTVGLACRTSTPDPASHSSLVSGDMLPASGNLRQETTENSNRTCSNPKTIYSIYSMPA